MVRPSIVLTAALMCGSALNAQQRHRRTDGVGGVPKIDSTTQSQDVRFRDRPRRSHDGSGTALRKRSLPVPCRYRRRSQCGFHRDRCPARSGASRALPCSTAALGLRPFRLRVPSLEFTAAGSEVDRSGGAGERQYGCRRHRRCLTCFVPKRVRFDFENKTMTIVPSQRRTSRRSPARIVVEARRKNGRSWSMPWPTTRPSRSCSTPAPRSVSATRRFGRLVGRSLVDRRSRSSSSRSPGR